MEEFEVLELIDKFVDEDTELDDLIWVEDGRIIATNEETLGKMINELQIGNPTIFIKRFHPGYMEVAIDIPVFIG